MFRFVNNAIQDSCVCCPQKTGFLCKKEWSKMAADSEKKTRRLPQTVTLYLVVYNALQTIGYVLFAMKNFDVFWWRKSLEICINWMIQISQFCMIVYLFFLLFLILFVAHFILIVLIFFIFFYFFTFLSSFYSLRSACMFFFLYSIHFPPPASVIFMTL